MMYILKDKNPVPCDDLMEWSEQFGTGKNQVAFVILPDGVRVSTVFLGFDHGWTDRPLWFETMIFGGKHDGYMDRYSTFEEAEAGHQNAIKLIFE